MFSFSSLCGFTSLLQLQSPHQEARSEVHGMFYNTHSLIICSLFISMNVMPMPLSVVCIHMFTHGGHRRTTNVSLCHIQPYFLEKESLIELGLDWLILSPRYFLYIALTCISWKTEHIQTLYMIFFIS